MKVWGLALAALLPIIAWFLFKDLAFAAWVGRGEPIQPQALDYAETASWAKRPDVLPEGAWQTPWGVDAFVIVSPPDMAATSGWVSATSEDSRSGFDERVSGVAATLPPEMGLYAPAFHFASAATGRAGTNRLQSEIETALVDAFSAYLENDNRGRAIKLVVTDRSLPLANAVLARLQEDDLRNRFAGLIVLDGQKLSESTLPRVPLCSPGATPSCVAQFDLEVQGPTLPFLLPSLPGWRGTETIVDARTVRAEIADRSAAVSQWLDNNAPKPAEPFGDFEEIDIAPIYRPGEITPIED